jgi:hypothetical protein
MTLRAIAIAALATLAGAGCIEGDLAPKSIVARWRVLAIQASHPEARPGDDVTFQPLVVTPDGEHATHGENGITFEWVACVRAEEPPGLGGIQYDPESPTEACGAAMLRMELETGADGSAVLPGFVSEFLWPDPGEVNDAFREMFGGALPPDAVTRLLTSVGIQVTVELIIRGDGAPIMSAYKRIMLVDREELGTNPPPPRFQIGDAWIGGRDVPEPWTCVPEDGVRPAIPRDQSVILSPDPDDEFWRDTYYVLDITGSIVAVEERPYYSFLSTAGAFDQEITRAPVREEIWRAPAEPGVYPLWLVVRDGHGGMSACRSEVEVE